jgi:hypothetical protein
LQFGTKLSPPNFPDKQEDGGIFVASTDQEKPVPGSNLPK